MNEESLGWAVAGVQFRGAVQPLQSGGLLRTSLSSTVNKRRAGWAEEEQPEQVQTGRTFAQVHTVQSSHFGFTNTVHKSLHCPISQVRTLRLGGEKLSQGQTAGDSASRGLVQWLTKWWWKSGSGQTLVPLGSPGPCQLTTPPCRHRFARKVFLACELRPASGESLPWNFGQVNTVGLAKPVPPMPSIPECHRVTEFSPHTGSCFCLDR